MRTRRTTILEGADKNDEGDKDVDDDEEKWAKVLFLI